MRIKNKNQQKSKIKLLYNNLYIIIKSINKLITQVNIINNEIIIELKKKNYLIPILIFFKNHYKTQMKILVDICTTDYLFKNNKRFEINYILLSIKYNFRIRIKLYLKENDTLPSIQYIYSSANWLERENWDMFGIFFNNHPDLRRILTDYGFEGFPFRKDFPLNGYIELRYDDEKRVVVYENIEITQEFRNFDFASPWDWKN